MKPELSVKPRVKVSVKFEPRDLWIGVYWEYDRLVFSRLTVYVCILPLLPIKVEVTWLTRKR